MDQSTRSSILVVDDEPIHRELATGVLTHAGWRVEAVCGGADALRSLRIGPPPALILMDLHMDGMSGLETVAAIRRSDTAAAAMPIICYTTTRIARPQTLHAHGFDAFLAKPATPRELTAAAARWLPDGTGAMLDRLEDSLGADQIRSMTRRLGVLFAEALDALDAGAAAGIAHRVAGIAGTLGFAAAGAAWLAISEGDESASVTARVETRRALATIAHRRTSPVRSTSV